MWDKLKAALGLGNGEKEKQEKKAKEQPAGRDRAGQKSLPEVLPIAAADNPWGVPLLGVHTVTQTMLSITENPQFAANAVSYSQDDGLGFRDMMPPSGRTIPATLRYPVEGRLVDGALFLPSEMEHKWALYFHANTILCIRSWQRTVVARAAVQQKDGFLEVTEVRGTFSADEETPEFTLRFLDFLLRSYALKLPYPAPIPEVLADHPGDAAMWCMSMYGKLALFATAAPLTAGPPDQPLRTYSLLHIAAARADIATMESWLAQGTPPDLPDPDGQPPLHWALSTATLAPATLLLERGARVDFRDPEGATMLMQMVQQGRLDRVRFLLERGADPNAADTRGFTALHRAADMGHLPLVELLLRSGASPHVEAQGYTPRALALSHNHHKIVALLDAQSR